MIIGQFILVKHNGEIQKGQIEKIYPEDLDILLEDNTLIRRKFWEIRKIDYKNDL